MRYSHRIDWSGKDATGWLHTRFTSLSRQCKSRSWTDLPLFPARSDALEREQRWSTTICERGCEVEPIQPEWTLWNAHWIWNRSRMGLFNNENDVTNITSESLNPCISLQFSTHTMEMEWIYIISSSILSIHWMEWVEFECDHELLELRFRFPLLLVQLSIRSIDASIHSEFDSHPFFSFYSTILSHRSKSLFIHFSCDPSFYCSLYSDHVRFNLFILIDRHQYHLFTIQCSRNHSVPIFPHRIKLMC